MNLLETAAAWLNDASAWLSQTVNRVLLDPPVWGLAAVLVLIVLVVLLLVFRGRERQPAPEKHATLPPPPPAREAPEVLFGAGQIAPTSQGPASQQTDSQQTGSQQTGSQEDDQGMYLFELSVSNLDDVSVQLFELTLTSAASGETLLYPFAHLLAPATSGTFQTTLERPAGSRVMVAVYLYAPGQRLFRIEGTLVYRGGVYGLEPLDQSLVVVETLPSSEARPVPPSRNPKRNRAQSRAAPTDDLDFPDEF